jgi:hypothetical protein
MAVAAGPSLQPDPLLPTIVLTLPFIALTRRTAQEGCETFQPGSLGPRPTPAARAMSDSSGSDSDSDSAAPPPAVTAYGRPARAATGRGDAMKPPVAYTPLTQATARPSKAAAEAARRAEVAAAFRRLVDDKGFQHTVLRDPRPGPGHGPNLEMQNLKMILAFRKHYSANILLNSKGRPKIF